MTGRNQDDGPRRFIRNWLSFNEQRPIQPSLLRKFILAVMLMLAVCVLLLVLRNTR